MSDFYSATPPPHSLEAEQSVIGSILTNYPVQTIAEILSPKEFYTPNHRTIYKSMLALDSKGVDVDLVTLSDAMGDDGSLDDVGGIAYLAMIARSTPSTANAKAYAKIVKQKSNLRQMQSAVLEIRDCVDPEEAMKLLQVESARLAENRAEFDVADSILLRGSDGFDSNVSWLIKDWIQDESLGMIYGPSGSFKSFSVIDMACSIATGIKWSGNKTYEGAVIYVAGEGQTGVGKRVKAWEIANGVKADHFFRFPRALNVTSPAERRLLADECAALSNEIGVPVKMIVFDTVNRCFGDGDENTAQDMTAFIQGCDQLIKSVGCSVMCVHHSGKDKDRGARGSSALRAAVDWEYFVDRVQAGLGYKIKGTKAKEFDEPMPHVAKLHPTELGISDDEGRPVTSLARFNDLSVDSGDGSKGDCLKTAAIDAMEAAGGEMARMAVRDVLINCQGDEIKPDSAKRKANDTISKLVESGKVKSSGSTLSIGNGSDWSDDLGVV